VSSTLTQKPVLPPKREITTKPRLSDKIFQRVVTGGGLSSLLILGLIFIFLLVQGFQTFKSQGIHFLTGSAWNAAVNDANQIDIKNSHFGIAAMLIGTLICAVIAIVIAVPISVFSALFLTFYVFLAFACFLNAKNL